MSTPETPATGPTLTPQQRLESLRTEVQNARNAPPVTPDRRTTLQNTLNALRTEASLDQAELDRLDQEIQTLPTPPPPPTPGLEEAFAGSGVPTEQIRQAMGTFEKIKRRIFMILGAIPFLRKWAQKHLKEMGMEEFADELRSPEEKKKTEDEKRKKEENQRKKEADERKKQSEQQRVASLNERIREKPEVDQAIHTYALAKAMRRFSTGVAPNFTAEQERLDLAGRPDGSAYHYSSVAQHIIDWLKNESGRSVFGLEIDGGDLEEADGTNWFADYDLIANFEDQLKNNPKVAFLNLQKLDLKQKMNKTAERMLPQLIKAMTEELALITATPRSSGAAPSAPVSRPASTSTASATPPTTPATSSTPPPAATA